MTGDLLVDDFLERNVEAIALRLAEDDASNSYYGIQRRMNKAFDDLAASISRSSVRMSVVGQAFQDASDAMELAYATIRQCENPCFEEVLA
jgi:hypothetical protein